MTPSLAKTITRSGIAAHRANHAISANEFISLYDELFPSIYTYARYRCSDLATADDLTASIFERALHHLDSFQSSIAPFSAWLFGIARNVINKHLRSLSSQHCLNMEEIPDHPSADPTPEEALIEREDYHELLFAMNVLDERERDLLGLKFASRFTNRRIAEISGLSESNVGVIIFRAIHKLRKELLSASQKTRDE